MIVVTAAEMRRLDALTIERGTAGHVLMERAGAGATKALLAQFPHGRRRRVVIFAGKGNNGGDGFVIARHLRRKGLRPEVVLLGNEKDIHGDAARMLTAARHARVLIAELTSTREVAKLPAKLKGATLLVDAVFGTGLNAEIRGLAADILHLMNTSGVPIFSVDIPSGLDADRGVPLGVAVHAEATATFGFPKLGQVVYPGVSHTGALTVVDIGIDAKAVAEVHPRTHLLEPSDVAPLVPVRAPEAHKGTCGHVLVIAASRGRTGAARLATRAACRSGAGLTTLATPASLNDIVASDLPETMTALLAETNGLVRFQENDLRNVLEGKTAIVLGPGMGTHDEARQVVRFLLGEVDLPIVVDADAITCLAQDLNMLKGARARVILTPHPGEMARLLGSDTAAVQRDRVHTARRFATEHGCVLVLKGARSIVATPEGTAWINPTGNPGMASGGMGDALSGILGGLLAQGLSCEDAARLGVYLHGEVADHLARERGEIGLLASDVIEGVPAGLRRLQAARVAAV